MVFKDLKIGDRVYILESAGTFRKINTYNVGTISQIGQVYDDMANPYMAQNLRKKLIDITIACEGVSKKLTVGADKTTITDNVIGLTVSTDKNELITQINAQCKEYEQKIQAIEFYKDEIKKCRSILELLQSPENSDIPSSDVIRVS